jgi:hypothetical protein
VKEAAARTGISIRTIYHLIRREKVPVIQGDGYRLIGPEGQEVLKKQQAKRQRIESDKNYARFWGKKTGINFESAMREIRRWRKDGVEETDIAKKIAHACGLSPANIREALAAYLESLGEE